MVREPLPFLNKKEVKKLKKLSFIRHAKSDWTSPLLADHDRRLADRGQKASAIMKDFFRTSNKKFDIVLSSTALRAVETIEIIKPSIKDTEIKYKKDGTVEKDLFLEKFIFGKDGKIHTVRQWRAAW